MCTCATVYNITKIQDKIFYWCVFKLWHEEKFRFLIVARLQVFNGAASVTLFSLSRKEKVEGWFRITQVLYTHTHGFIFGCLDCSMCKCIDVSHKVDNKSILCTLKYNNRLI